MKAHYYFRNIKSDPSKRNDWCIAVLYGDWPDRNLSTKGMTKFNKVLSRNLKEGEMSIANKYRMTFFKYYKWSNFIQDEMSTLGITRNHQLIQDLIEIKTKRFGSIIESNFAE